ncbi:right-handed parallel beta-helix repeat-containing protein, partial [bacterium]|nr:right-handed parallel beta-helix repeat-containing protein [bacterium]
MMRLCFVCVFALLTFQLSYSQDCNLPPAIDVGAEYSKELHVSPQGSDNNGDGSQVSPFHTLGRAARDAFPGTIIHLSTGNHITGQYITNLQGTESSPIKIIGPEDGEAVFSGGNTAIQLTDPAYVVLENFTIEGAAANGINIDDGMSYTTPAHHVVLRNLVVRDIGPEGNHDGIKLSGLDHFRVERCRIEHPGSGGSFIDMVGCHDGEIAHNIFRDGGSSGVQAKGGSARVVI